MIQENLFQQKEDSYNFEEYQTEFTINLNINALFDKPSICNQNSEEKYKLFNQYFNKIKNQFLKSYINPYFYQPFIYFYQIFFNYYHISFLNIFRNIQEATHDLNQIQNQLVSEIQINDKQINENHQINFFHKTNIGINHQAKIPSINANLKCKNYRIQATNTIIQRIIRKKIWNSNNLLDNKFNELKTFIESQLKLNLNDKFICDIIKKNNFNKDQIKLYIENNHKKIVKNHKTIDRKFIRTYRAAISK